MSRSWIYDRRQETRQLSEYAGELEAKLRAAEKALADVATGLHDAAVVSNDWRNDVKLQATAANRLAKISAMPCRKRPWGAWA